MTGTLEIHTRSPSPSTLSVNAHLPEDISGTYEDKFGQISLGILPVDPEEKWETMFDLGIDEAMLLRDTLTSLIAYLERHQ